MKYRVTSMAQRSRRRLSFPPAEEPGEVCALCGTVRMRTSKYLCWKNASSQQCAQSLGVDAESPICCPCRDDISRLVKDPSYVPRWGKKVNKENCFVANCDGESFSRSTTIGIDDLTKLGLCTPDAVLPVPLPLCKHHYFLAKNKQINVQTHCPMCNMSIRLRSCPESDSINRYLLEQTGFEGHVSKDTKVCFSCYKYQLPLDQYRLIGAHHIPKTIMYENG